VTPPPQIVNVKNKNKKPLFLQEKL
jgi:hypothetical protein